MAKSGRRPGTPKTGGRKAGVSNSKTKVIVTEAMLSGITPLEHMLAVVRTPMPTQMDDESPEAFMARCKWHVARQDSMAQAAAPYLHPRLANIVHKEDEAQFKDRHQEMDIMETARRMAFIFATADQQDDESASRH